MTKQVKKSMVPKLRFPEFRDAGEWEEKPLETIAKVRGGKRLPKGRALIGIPNTHPYIRVLDMKNGSVNITNIMYVPDDVFPKIRNYRIYSSDLFISVAGTLGIIGKVPKALDGANLTENANRICDLKINRDFLFHYLSYDKIQNFIQSMQTIGAQPKLALGRIEKFIIPVPLLENEQTAIANCLSSVDDLITAQTQKIDALKAHKKGLMQKLFPTEGETVPKLRFPKFRDAGEWGEKNMAQDSYLKARIGWQGLTTAEYLETGEYILVTGTDFKNGKIDWNNCCYVEKERYDQDRNIQVKVGDILLTKDGTIGKAAYVDHISEPATLNSGVFVIRPINNSYNPLYFYYVLKSKIFAAFLNKLQAGSTINHLYQKDFVDFSFAVPTANEQKAIADCLSSVDELITAQTQKIDALKAHKKGLMQQLFPLH